MKRAMLWVAAACALSLASAALAGESGQTRTQTGRAERAKERLQNLSPEERAKFKEQWATMSPEERAQARAKMREQLAGDRPAPEAAPKSAAEQVAALKQEHQATVGALQSIKSLAVKEKATETAKALDALIARHQESYQRRLKQMEQRLQRVQAAHKDAAQTAPKTDTNASTAPAQKRVKDAGKQRQP